MKIVYVGNWRPAHSTENHVAASLRELGHQVVQVQEDEVNNRHTWRARAVPRMAGASLVLYTRTWGLPEAATHTWKALRARGIATATYHLDLFWNLDREVLVRRRDPMFTTEFVCTADGDPHPWGDVDHRWVRAGVLREECTAGSPQRQWRGYDVAFVGSSVAYHAEWPYRRRLLAHLRGYFGDRLLIVPGRNEPAIRGQALNDLYASVPVLIGDSLAMARERACYWSDRVYETLGRGGVLIHPRIDALVEEVGHLAAFHTYEWGDFDGLCAQIDTLADEFRRYPHVRAGVTTAARGWTAAHASYTNRMEQLLTEVFG